MRCLAGAVSVVTVGREGRRTGFTATSVSSFSADPPSMLVCLNRDSSSWPVLADHGCFCINLLASGQSHVADRFAGRDGVKGTARYEGARWHTMSTGALALDGALASIDCVLEEAIERHSHAILIGRVAGVHVSAGADPLLYWHGAYRLISSLDWVLTSA
jgi:flavin reductase (DIM6/NTAB) family NADH-FMN oxidoreductase RutF